MYVHYGVMVRPGGLPGAGYLTGFYNSGTVVWVPPRRGPDRRRHQRGAVALGDRGGDPALPAV
jgi:hypothetical protein